MIPTDTGIERFATKFKRTTSLPTLPHTPTALIRAIDGGEASAADLERIIAADPSLCVMMLRAAACVFAGNAPSSLRGAIVRLGHREIRSIAISLAVKRVLDDGSGGGFDVTRFARHSLAVGFLARFLAARRQRKEPFRSNWTSDELFAAGVLHDIGQALLARVAPEDYGRVEWLARRTKQSFRAAFARIYECELGHVGAYVASTWELPPIFAEAMQNMHTPWRKPEESVALSVLSYADYLADSFRLSTEDWPIDPMPLVEAEMEVGISPEERANLRDVICRHVDEMLNPAP